LQKHHKTVNELGVLRETVFRLTMDESHGVNQSQRHLPRVMPRQQQRL